MICRHGWPMTRGGLEGAMKVSTVQFCSKGDVCIEVMMMNGQRSARRSVSRLSAWDSAVLLLFSSVGAFEGAWYLS